MAGERIRSAKRRSFAAGLRADIDWLDARREAGTYFRKFKRLDLLEAASRRPHQFVFHSDKMSNGLVRFCADTQIMKDVTVLWPVGREAANDISLKLEDIHQIIRELVTGIYVFNEIPDIKLACYRDNSGAALCLLPLPYEDTRVGQVLIDVIAAVNAHLNGVEFPSERRRRFAQTWRDTMKVGKREKTPPTTDLAKVYADAGLQEIKESPFMNLNTGSVDRHAQYGITVTGDVVQQHDNVFVMDPQWHPTSHFNMCVNSFDIADHIESHRTIQSHFDVFREVMLSTPETRHNLVLLQFIGCMTQLLTALKCRCKVPDFESFRLPLRADDLKTERELPPLYVKNSSRVHGFGHSRHLVQQEGFITFHKSICDCVPMGEAMMRQYERLGVKHDYADSDQFSHSRVTLDDCIYAALCLKLESYYATSPKLPPWIHAMVNEMANQVAGIPTLSDSQIQEVVRQRLGSRQAAKVKSTNALLVLSVQHGLSSVIEVIAKRSAQTRLSNASNDDGLALLHHAAMHDQVCIIHFLAQRGCDVNVRRLHLSGDESSSQSVSQMGETPLHVAARCGCLSSICCLVLNDADPCMYDAMKWMPIHHCAFHNHSEIVHYLISNDTSLLESRTDDDKKATPLMQATLGGSLDTVKQLVQLGADLGVVDGFGKSLVHAAAMNLHVNILLFYAQCDSPSLCLFDLLVDMLKSPLETGEPVLAAQCLDPVTTAHASYWEKLIKAGGVVALAHLLKSSDVTVQASVALVLQNISGNPAVQQEIVAAGAVPDLVSLLKTPNGDIQSRCSVVLADVGTVDENCDSIAAQGAIEHLVSLLHSENSTVQLNSSHCIRVLVDENPKNQSAFLSYNGMLPLIRLLSVNSEDIQACAAETVKAVTTGFEEAQDAFVDNNGIRLLIILLRSRDPRVQVAAARAMEAVADGNVKAQIRIMFGDDGTARTHPIGTHALKRLLKFKTPELKINGASALWSVAGTTVANQRHVASLIGIDMLVQLLSLRNERLAIVASQAIHALSTGPAAFRHKIGESGGVLPLVRLLKPQEKSSAAVLINVARTLVSLCVGPANTPHTENQNTIAEGRGILYLVELMDRHSDLLVRAKAAWVLSCISLGNMPVQQSIVACPNFNFVSILQMLRSKSDEVCLCAGMALAMFAYNSLTHQKAIKDVGGVPYVLFKPYLQSEQETQRGYAAFQTVILAKVLKGAGEITVTIQGLETLISLLCSKSEESQIVSADCLASLAHTRAGISAAITAAGGVKLLLKKLGSPVEAVSASAATALGYLSFNGTAAREMMTAMRTDPRLYDVFHRHTVNGKVSPEFVENWEDTVKIGLPSLFLESRGGPPVIMDKRPMDGRISVPLIGWHPGDRDFPSPFRFGSRSKSISTQGVRSTKTKSKRCISAPAYIPRQQSVGSISATFSSTTVASRKRSGMKGSIDHDHDIMPLSRQQAVTFDNVNS